jgi:hypothetical protein
MKQKKKKQVRSSVGGGSSSIGVVSYVEVAEELIELR